MTDFIIIGSGVSGGRIAYELTEAGAQCTLVEAGKEFSADTFPKNEFASSTQLFWGGGLEFNHSASMGLLRAKVLGGTSIVNQALLDRFDNIAWNDWNQVSGIDYFNEQDMEQHYLATEANLSVSEIPAEHFNKNTKLFISSFEKNQLGWKPLRRAQGDCKLDKGSDCMVCLGGCPRSAKQSSLETVIKAARAKGLKIETEFEVYKIHHSKDEVKIMGTQRGEEKTLKAPRIVLAGGAFGNTAILLRSNIADQMPALGTGFACHPQFMTYALFKEPIDAHKGAFQGVKSFDPKLRSEGLKLENVFAPPCATAMLLPGMGHKHHEKMKKYRYLASLEVAIRDDAVGSMRVDKKGKFSVHKEYTSADKKKVKNGLSLVRNLFETLDAKEIINCPQSFGLHLMGGCPVGVDGAKSVVDPNFNIHGFENIAIADSSVFPGAPGINPSFTIMALSHRASQNLIKGGASR